MKAIVAVNNKGVIGHEGDIPWYSPDDLKHFKKKTKFSTCLISRKTYDSLPQSMKTSEDTRTYLIVSRDNNRGISLQQALDRKPNWILGGGEIYKQTLHLCDELHLSIIDNDMEGDTKFPFKSILFGDKNVGESIEEIYTMMFGGKLITYNFDELQRGITITTKNEETVVGKEE
jgi:dihydrofolate reductase